MSKATRATSQLDAAGVAYGTLSYAYDPGAERIGLAAAQAVGVAPEALLKTLMVLVDGKPVVAVLPAPAEVAMKKLAAALGGKHAEMMPPDKAERLSGYKVGGISPFGQMRKAPVVVDAGAMALAQVVINGGQRGLLVQLAPADAVRVLGAQVAAICA